MSMRKILPAICGLVLISGLAFADNWPRFRGPNGTGISSDKDVPIKWSDNENVLWKTAIPGAGNSSPVIWGDHLFVQSSANDGKERMLLCLRASDGKILWSRNAPATTFKTLNKRNSYASSTPATDGERVCTIFWDGNGQTVHAYDFKGAPLWQYNLGAFTSQHGAGTSPIIHDGKVYINNDQDGSAVVVCLDAKTGKPVWQVERPAFRVSYSVPFILERPGEPTALVVGSTAGITGYNPADGSELWSYKWSFTGMPLRTVGSPIFHDGMIFLPGGDGSGARDMIAVKLGGKGDITAKGLVWRSQNKAILPYVPTILARGEHLYYVNDAGIAHCMVAKTGQVVWSERLGSPVSASPVLIDGKVYALGENGDVYVFAADPAGFKLLAKNSTGEPSRSSPAVADNRLFLRCATHLFCITRK